MAAIALNQAQIDIIEMMSFVKEPNMLGQLKQIISDFFAQQAQQEIDRLWDNGTLTDAKVEGFRNLHQRTPYL